MIGIMRYVYVLVLCFGISASCVAQSAAYTQKDYPRSPVWISMIKDTSVNFFEAEKAYKTYFKHHERPEGENEEIGEHAKREKYPSKRERRKMQRENQMRAEVKKYERWREMMLPYVQEDGRILTPAERIEIWKSQRTNRK